LSPFEKEKINFLTLFVSLLGLSFKIGSEETSASEKGVFTHLHEIDFLIYISLTFALRTDLKKSCSESGRKWRWI